MKGLILSTAEVPRAVTPVVDYSVRDLCCRPYPLHGAGCPNYGKRQTCPPAAQRIEDIIDLSREVGAVWTVFDLASHVEKMRAAHPGWSRRQLECCLYWQGAARKALREKIQRIVAPVENIQNLVILKCPEACGVNVTATMASIGEILEWPPMTKTYQVALIGWRRK